MVKGSGPSSSLAVRVEIIKEYAPRLGSLDRCEYQAKGRAEEKREKSVLWRAGLRPRGGGLNESFGWTDNGLTA